MPQVIRHLVTGEFPPSSGGVAGYTAVVAEALAAAGEEVHVWCPGTAGTSQPRPGLLVHRVLGSLSAADLANADCTLARFPGPRRLLVQWVPQAYGRRSLNMTFCRWVQSRTLRHRDRVEIMVHEPFLPFGGGVKRSTAALLHRWMLRTVLSGATRAYVPTRRWEDVCRPFALRLPFSWMPVPSGIACPPSLETAPRSRASGEAAGEGIVVGSFGNGVDMQALPAIAAALHVAHPSATLLLIGAGSVERRSALIAAVPEAAAAVLATGPLAPDAVSASIRRCALCVQPYADGVSGRRSSAMAVLAHGVPLLSTRGVATEPVWAVNPELTVPAAALTATMLRLLPDAARRARLGQDGFDLYESHFHVRHTVRLLRAAD